MLQKNHVKNRQKTMKDRWCEVHDLFNGLSGFAWSSMTKRFGAEGDGLGWTNKGKCCYTLPLIHLLQMIIV